MRALWTDTESFICVNYHPSLLHKHLSELHGRAAACKLPDLPELPQRFEPFYSVFSIWAAAENPLFPFLSVLRTNVSVQVGFRRERAADVYKYWSA